MYNAKQVIVVRRDLKMRKGKIAAQSGHACVEAVLLALAKEDRLNDVNATNGWISLENKDREATPLSEWFANGVAKICVYVDSEEALLDLESPRKRTRLRHRAHPGCRTHRVPRRTHLHLHGVRTPVSRANRPAHRRFAAVLTCALLRSKAVRNATKIVSVGGRKISTTSL